jgi:hypothetical protein
MKLWVIRQLIYYWDVLFTLVDEWQQRRWVTMCNWERTAISEDNDKYNMKHLGEHESWEELE